MGQRTGGETPVGIGGRRDTGACAAPAAPLYVRPDGDVRVCVLNGVLQERHGEFVDYRVQSESADRSDLTFVLGGREVMAVLLARRDDTGWTETADVLITCRDPAAVRAD